MQTKAALGLLGLFAMLGCSRPGITTAVGPEPSANSTGRLAPAPSPASEPEDSPASAGKNIPGAFDYYVLSLSWSPQHCASRGNKVRSDDAQCGSGGGAFGFVVHGLWPEYVNGYPESCAVSTAVAPELISRMLRIMPSARLIQHEWSKHGTCSGLLAEQYFAHVEELAGRLKIPQRYQALAESLTTSVAALRAELLAENPALPKDGSSLRVICQGEFLQELRFCYEKDFRPRSCSEKATDFCRSADIVIRPILHPSH